MPKSAVLELASLHALALIVIVTGAIGLASLRPKSLIVMHGRS